MKILLGFLLLIVVSLASGCEQQQNAHRGFALPAGEVESGKLVFLDKHCIECHTLAGADFADKRWQYTEQRDINVIIGGSVSKVKTYGDLVTSVINPSHRVAKGYSKDYVLDLDGESKMRVYNQVMTIEELVDLVTFLQSQYRLVPPPVTKYPHYIYPHGVPLSSS
ncbi:MAG: hypothetical protein ACJAQ6_001480 [Arenicella sp.]|jgi:hypothetical protein